MDIFVASIVVFITLVLAAVSARQVGLWTVTTLVFLMFFVGFGIRDLIFASDDNARIFQVYNFEQGEFETTAIYSVIGIAFFSLGAFLLRSSEAGITTSKVAECRPLRAPSATVATAFILLFLLTFITQITLAVIAFGGISQAINLVGKRNIFSSSLGNIAEQLWHLSLPLSLGATVIAYRSSNKVLLSLAALCLAGGTILSAFFNGRAAVVVVLWALALTFRARFGRQFPWYALAGGALLAIVIITLGSAWRVTAQVDEPFGQALSEASPKAVLLTSDALPLVDQLIVARRYSDEVGHDWGALLPEGLTILIPRDIWNDKPHYMPEKIGRTVQHVAYGGIPAGAFGEGFISFGALGIPLFAFIFGFLVNQVDRFLMRTSTDVVAAWFAFEASLIGVDGTRVGIQNIIVDFQFGLLGLAVLLMAFKTVQFLAPRRG